MWGVERTQLCSTFLCLTLGVALAGCGGDDVGASNQVADQAVTEQVEPEAAEEESQPVSEADGSASAEGGPEEPPGDDALDSPEDSPDGSDAAAAEAVSTEDADVVRPPGSEHQPVATDERISRRAVKVTVVEGEAKTVKLVCDGRDLGTKPLGKTRTTLFNAATGSCHFVFDGKELARSGRVKSGTHVKCVVKGAVARCK